VRDERLAPEEPEILAGQTLRSASGGHDAEDLKFVG
jgi:hypothetical protein